MENWSQAIHGIYGVTSRHPYPIPRSVHNRSYVVNDLWFTSTSRGVRRVIESRNGNNKIRPSRSLKNQFIAHPGSQVLHFRFTNHRRIQVLFPSSLGACSILHGFASLCVPLLHLSPYYHNLSHFGLWSSRVQALSIVSLRAGSSQQHCIIACWLRVSASCQYPTFIWHLLFALARVFLCMRHEATDTGVWLFDL